MKPEKWLRWDIWGTSSWKCPRCGYMPTYKSQDVNPKFMNFRYCPKCALRLEGEVEYATPDGGSLFDWVDIGKDWKDESD